MESNHPIKIPVLNILAGSLLISWREKARFSRALALPTLLLVSAWALTILFMQELKEVGPWVVWLLYLFYLLAFSIFAVTCHRLILTTDEQSLFSVPLTRRQLKFAAWFIVVYIIYNLAKIAISITLLKFGLEPAALNPGSTLPYATVIASTPAMYIMARLSLVFPATAVDTNIGLKWSWQCTRHNGWRMVVIIGLYPGLISALLWLVSREATTAIEQAIIGLFYYLGAAVEIFALSLTYKEIAGLYIEDTLTA